jgi:D-alanyl-D-alanine dipeptidase
MQHWHQPIPDMTPLRAVRRGARSHAIDLSSQENRERAVDVRAHGIAGENYYHLEKDNPPYYHRAPGSIPALLVREGLLSRLLAVNAILEEHVLELFLFDAYRPVEVQNYFYDHWVPNVLRRENPHWSEEEIVNETSRYWAKGALSMYDVDPLSPPPHATGGVVDLSLRSITTKELLDMGSAFDAVDTVSFVDHFERLAQQRPLSTREETALLNRRLLYWVMREAGCVVNPNEWWHFGYGDQLSAILSGRPYAVYSTMDIV